MNYGCQGLICQQCQFAWVSWMDVHKRVGQETRQIRRRLERDQRGPGERWRVACAAERRRGRRRVQGRHRPEYDWQPRLGWQDSGPVQNVRNICCGLHSGHVCHYISALARSPDTTSGRRHDFSRRPNTNPATCPFILTVVRVAVCNCKPLSSG